jgi:putative tryptophan/tyrosine transport system substrate-binding protein
MNFNKLFVADIERAFQSAAKNRAEALILLSSPVLTQRKQIAEVAEKHRVPAIYSRPEDVISGGLLSYGVNVGDPDRRAAV